MLRIALICALFSAPAWASCPAVPDRSAELSALIDEARAAPNDMAGRAVSDKMWAIWATAPDEIAQEMLDRGMVARRVADYLAAIKAFDDLVAYCPDYAEGYNQRAFVHFLAGAYDTAIVDLRLALDRSPRHVAALAGLALSLMGLGQDGAAQVVLRQALALNPWLPERGLLRDLPGEDL